MGAKKNDLPKKKKEKKCIYIEIIGYENSISYDTT